MKKYALATLSLFIVCFCLHADIINGFAQAKHKLEKKIRATEELLENPHMPKNTKRLSKKLRRLTRNFELVSIKYAQTESLLGRFESIDPELYGEVSNVSNAEGTMTHVYVRYVSKSSKEFAYLSNNHFPAQAYTSVSPTENNCNVCASFYGENTIAVTIGIGCNEILALAHEFAHVLYIVPNLKDYTYFMNYLNKKVNQTSCHGHSLNDPSRGFMKSVLNKFALNYERYLSKNEMDMNLVDSKLNLQ